MTTEARIEDLLAALSLEEKAALTGGDDVWHLPAVDHVGLGRLKVSDGPSGVRGERIGTRRSLSFPCGMAAGATWDVDLLGRYGAVLAGEATAKGVHVLLGPTVCIPRTPLAGRTFESFAEDPFLSARAAVAYIAGVQAGGVGCCVKHFACNDQEHERMTISAEVDERTLRGDPPAVVRGGGPRRRRVVDHVGLQPGQRHVLWRAPRVARVDPQAGVGLRRRGHLRLVRDPQRRPGLRRPASTWRCRDHPTTSVASWPAPSKPASWTSRSWTITCAASCAWPSAPGSSTTRPPTANPRIRRIPSVAAWPGTWPSAAPSCSATTGSSRWLPMSGAWP